MRLSKKMLDPEKPQLGMIDRWYHPSCFVQRREELGFRPEYSASQLKGFGLLTPEDKEALKKQLPGVKGEGWVQGRGRGVAKGFSEGLDGERPRGPTDSMPLPCFFLPTMRKPGVQTRGRPPLSPASPTRIPPPLLKPRSAGKGCGTRLAVCSTSSLSSGAGGVREPRFPATALGGASDTAALTCLSSPLAPHVSHVSSGPHVTRFTSPWPPPVWHVPSCQSGAGRVVTVFTWRQWVRHHLIQSLEWRGLHMVMCGRPGREDLSGTYPESTTDSCFPSAGPLAQSSVAW